MKTVLSIDGGGIRGLIPATVLAKLEQETGRPAAECFDLVTGTSTGGILGLALAKPGPDGAPQFSARDLVRLYTEHGGDIFARSLWRGVSSVGGITDELYSHRGLERLLRTFLGNATLGDALTNVMVTTYDIERREPLFLKSWRDEFANVLLKHAARATSAAPTYFEPAWIPVEGKMRALVDGGVFINSPAVSAYAEAQRIFPGEEIFVLSLGTGELTRPIERGEARDWGKVGWLAPLLGCIFDGVADAADYQMQRLLGDNYLRLQVTLETGSDDMDDVTRGNVENLQREARRLLRERRDELAELCTRLR